MSKFNIEENLFSYQAEDVIKMLEPGGFLNCSEMGTGKTPQAIAVVEKGGFNIPLIVCPNSLRLEWKRQIEEWTEEKVAVSTSDTYTRMKPIIDSLIDGKKYRVVNYEVFWSKDNLELLNQIPFDIVIFDECHKLRNPEIAKIKKVVKGVWEFMEHHPNTKAICMSGSPIMNYPNDLYVPLSIVKPNKWPRNKEHMRYFINRYSFVAQGRYGVYTYGTDSGMLKYLKADIEPFLLRRTKKEALPYLPDKYYRRIELEMPSEQRKLYEKMENELSILLDSGEPLHSASVIACLMRLRQLNLDPRILGVSSQAAKTDFIEDLMEEMEGTDQKVVIFSTFEKYIRLLEMLLQKYNPVVVTGTKTPLERQRAVKAFQENPEVKVFLGTIQSGGEGITLTASNTVVLMDRWWNEPTNQQAIDRTHRIGQKNAVEVIYPIIKDSVDETLDEVLQRKSEASEGFLQESQVRNIVIEARGLSPKFRRYEPEKPFMEVV